MEHEPSSAGLSDAGVSEDNDGYVSDTTLRQPSDSEPETNSNYSMEVELDYQNEVTCRAIVPWVPPDRMLQLAALPLDLNVNHEYIPDYVRKRKTPFNDVELAKTRWSFLVGYYLSPNKLYERGRKTMLRWSREMHRLEEIWIDNNDFRDYTLKMQNVIMTRFNYLSNKWLRTKQKELQRKGEKVKQLTTRIKKTEAKARSMDESIDPMNLISKKIAQAAGFMQKKDIKSNILEDTDIPLSQVVMPGETLPVPLDEVDGHHVLLDGDPLFPVN